MMNSYFWILIFSSFLFFTACTSLVENEIDLSGEWTVVLDSLNQGLENHWAGEKINGTTIHLPGTLDDAGIGAKNTLKPAMNNYVLSGLTRKHQYIGAAWYQKEINIPESWSAKKVELKLERIIWESQVFVDGEKVGSSESLIVPHKYDLSTLLKPGKHLLTIRIDNSNMYPFINVKGLKYPDPVNQDMAHAYTNHTQIKWNGIIGDIILSAREKRSIEDIQIWSELDQGIIKATFKNSFPADEKLVYYISSSDGEILTKGVVENGSSEILLPKPEGVFPWDEFNPNLYDFKILPANGEADQVVSARFGYRQIKNDSGVLKLNGNRIFLRGNLECAIFPLTGHPPMQKEEWARLITQAKAYGLNHLRFHSWCPPKAAFEAADEAGFYYQVELPHWSLNFGKDLETTKYLLKEADDLLSEYGNHPSFVLMALGNELEGNVNLMNSTVARLKAKDNRHLYTSTAYSFQYPLGTFAQPQDDFFVTQKTDKGWIRGQGVFNLKSPNFNEDYTANSEHITVPLISHEIGQYSVFPDMSEIDKYTGVLSPLNFMAIKKELEHKGLIQFAHRFTQASGKLAAMLYKEEIERALKTPAFDGFQLLQLQDFPGQGTALVGLLNAFWESKGIISAKEFKQFNGEVVPLLRFEKAVYEVGEKFTASLEVANFYQELKDKVLVWTITDEDSLLIAKGTTENVDLHIGNNRSLGDITFDVRVEKASKLVIAVAIQGTEYKNSWPIWVYPKIYERMSGDVFITGSIKEAKLLLDQGENVLLNPDYKSLKGIEGRFVPVFWSPVHFPNQPSTMGLLMNEKHAAFNDFPTSSHTEWQWWDLCIHSKSINIDSLNVTPIVRVIDNFVTNHHLANVFEAKVGKGKLIFSSIDLSNGLGQRIVARQLRNSLLQYMQSEEFNPIGSVHFEDLDFINKEHVDKFNESDIYTD